MTVEEVKARLRRYNDLRHECRKLRQEIERRRSDMEAPHAVRADALPGGRGNSLEEAVEKIDVLERRLQYLKHEADSSRADVEMLIALADDEDGAAFMRLYFLDGVRFQDIAGKYIFRSRSSIYEHYRIALEQVWTKINCQ